MATYIDALNGDHTDGSEQLTTSYIVLYRREDIMAPADAPFAFQCWAESTEHAEEQLLNAEPDADIVWVVMTDDVGAAYADYWDTPAGFTNDEV
jgi:hypothetical protein